MLFIVSLLLSGVSLLFVWFWNNDYLSVNKINTSIYNFIFYFIECFK